MKVVKTSMEQLRIRIFIDFNITFLIFFFVLKRLYLRISQYSIITIALWQYCIHNITHIEYLYAFLH